MDLTIGVSTNRQKIGNLLDVNLEGWRAVGINEVGSDKVLLWVNLENDRSNATYDDGFISGSKIFQWESQNKQDINTKKKLKFTYFVGLELLGITHIWGN